ncbi:MAG: hypothetical protein EU541_01520 [Promethearchaeota archaeon]|nr:MAG: hypothetical protein EU541_01520 [Candidatus Lokiarchaeota archaeon]
MDLNYPKDIKIKEEKLSDFNHLISIIENSENIKDRIESLQELAKVGEANERYYNLLENLLISDSNHKIRYLAANSLKELFLNKSFIPMKWSFKHESSVKCLIAITNTLGAINNSKSRKFLWNELQNVSIKKYREHIDTLLEKRKLDGYSGPKLAELLNNCHVIRFLENKFGKLRYSLKLGKVIRLDLSNANSHVFNYKILKLPDFIGVLKDLTKLDLRFNRIKSIPNSIKNLTSIKYLDLSYNKIKKLPTDINSLQLLEYLNLKSNKIMSLPQGIKDLSNLKTLNLRSNNLASIPNNLDELENLEELILRGNNLDKLPLSFVGSHLRILELGLNNFKIIPNSLRNLKDLKILGLEGNQIHYIPQWIGKLDSLEILRLHNNHVHKLPSSIGNLNKLEKLTLWNNNLKLLPDSFKKLTNLKNLNLNWNNLERVPKNLPQNLEILSLWGNKIHKIPKSIEKLTKLKILDLNFNKDLDLSKDTINLEKNGLIIYK